MHDEGGSLREFRGKARELGGLCLRASELENDRIGAGLHEKDQASQKEKEGLEE